MEARLAAVVAANAPGVAVNDVCASIGVSRETLRHWRRRFAEEGLTGLEPRSRRPHRSPNATSAEMEEAIVRLRKELPLDNGSEVIHWHLAGAGLSPPSVRTIDRVLSRRGLVSPQPKKRPRSSWRRFEFDRPNECWQIDATSWCLDGGEEVSIMDTIDDHSRVSPASRVGRGPTTELAIETVLLGAERWGLPAMVLSDNGPCFAGRQPTAGAATFEATMAALGVRVIHSRAYHPQTCGKVERFHQTVKRWLARQPLAADMATLQAQLDAFADHYNHHRPHRAIGRQPPAPRHGATPAAQPSATPLQTPAPTSIVFSAVGVKRSGAISIGGQWQTSVGTEFAGRRLTVVRLVDQALILDGGDVVSRVHLDPTRSYLPSGRKRGGPRRRPPTV